MTREIKPRVEFLEARLALSATTFGHLGERPGSGLESHRSIQVEAMPQGISTYSGTYAMLGSPSAPYLELPKDIFFTIQGLGVVVPRLLSTRPGIEPGSASLEVMYVTTESGRTESIWFRTDLLFPAPGVSGGSATTTTHPYTLVPKRDHGGSVLFRVDPGNSTFSMVFTPN